MQVVNDSGTPQIEEILADTPIASTISLPVVNMRKRVFDRNALAQFRAASRRGLPFAQFGQQPLVGVNGDASSARAGRTPFAQKAARTLLLGKVHRVAKLERDHDLIRAGDRLGGPIQAERGLGKP